MKIELYLYLPIFKSIYTSYSYMLPLLIQFAFLYSKTTDCENSGPAQFNDCRSSIRSQLRVVGLATECHHHVVQRETSIASHKGE